MNNEISRLKAKFDNLVEQREEARKRIDPDIGGSDNDYLRLEQEVFKAYGELMDARYEAGEGMLD